MEVLLLLRNLIVQVIILFDCLIIEMVDMVHLRVVGCMGLSLCGESIILGGLLRQHK